jgi:hypothetical protein
MYRPPQCTEREPDGTWEDCTWASGVMLWNAVNGRARVPSTRKEYEALRVAGGDGPAEKPGDGSNLAQLQLGMDRRYGWGPNRIGPPGTGHPSWSTLLQHLDQPGNCAVVQGEMSAWPRDSKWNRWDRQFRGSHAAYVQRESDLARVWWMNPLAPASFAGEWMSLTDLRRFWDSWIGGAALGQVGRFAPPDTATEDTVYSIPEADGPYAATVDANTPVYGSAEDTTANGTLSQPTKPFMVVGASKGATPTTGRRALHGRRDGSAVLLGWVDVSRINR